MQINSHKLSPENRTLIHYGERFSASHLLNTTEIEYVLTQCYILVQ